MSNEKSNEKSSDAWYVSGPFGVRGPMNEAQLRKHLANPETLQVKQGFSPWYPANIIRKKLSKLDQEGIYIYRNGAAEGPYTLPKAYEMLKQTTDPSIQVKTTAKGQWVPVAHWIATIQRLKDR